MNLRQMCKFSMIVCCAMLSFAAAAHDAIAATYDLPVVSTATLIVSQQNYSRLGEPGVPHELLLNPQSLQFGYDAATDLVYESVIVFDRAELAPYSAAAGWVDLHLTSVSMPTTNGGYGMWKLEQPHDAVADLSDFLGQRLFFCEDVCAPYGAEYSAYVDMLSAPEGYEAWILSSFGSTTPAIVAGVGSSIDPGGPHMVLHVIPEPSSLVCLGLALSSLAGSAASMRRRGRK
ncbi:MAG: PEP-CTERM sorting domain-containing protein [Armatimonadetes bacterium]|nr:PEP-CTERM sorting domain-containing protein [Armatimonadota bacterium]